MKETEGFYEYYVPLIVNYDLKRLNPNWNIGDIYGVIYTKFSRKALEDTLLMLTTEKEKALTELAELAKDRKAKMAKEIKETQDDAGNKAKSGAQGITRRSFLFSVIALLITLSTMACGLFLVISKIVTAPIQKTVKLINNSKNDLDLSVRGEAKSNDEIHEMTDSFNSLMGTLCTSLASISNASKEVTSISSKVK